MKRSLYNWSGPVLGLCLLVGTGCQSPEPQDDMAEGTEEVEMVNTLSDAEREAGWMLLFDGQTTNGWRGYRSDSLPSKWVITEDALHFNPAAEGAGGDIMTGETFDNFELSLEWKIGECGNSGIFYRVMEDERYANTYHTAPEYQVLDNSCHPDAQNGLDRTAAANYALDAPMKDASKPAGEWNQTRIVVDSAHVEHWLNGEKVVEYTLWTDEWKAKVAATKFNEWKDYGLAKSGHIALQDHGDPVWYRNIKVRPLR